MEMDLSAATDFKRRGLFKALVYELSGTLSGRFELSAQPEVQRRWQDSTIVWGEPYVSLPLGDVRGLSRAPTLSWNGEEARFEQGSGLSDLFAGGIHASVQRKTPDEAESFDFELTLALRGTESLAFVPLADTTRVKLSSSWPHPSFRGRFLPDPSRQHSDAEGFAAAWEITALATRAPSDLLAAANGVKTCNFECLESFGIRFVEPVNIYSKADRATKYGFLFVALSFAAFFLFEVIRSLRIHPVQYLLVGLALALFFLLLLSLSEHMAFALAYPIAAAACVGLQLFYLTYVLAGRLRALGFGLMLGLLFAALYGLLIAEDTALLMGSGLLFMLLALTMFITRRLDWYAVGTKTG